MKCYVLKDSGVVSIKRPESKVINIHVKQIKEKKFKYVYDSKRTTIFPRMYSNQPNHVQRYREITNLNKNQNPTFF